MRFCHQGDRGHIPSGLMFFLAGHLFDSVTTFASRFIRLDAGGMERMIGHVHRTSAARFRTSQMFMLKRLDESTVSFTFLL
jgi:hypothetical protein